MIFSSIPGSNHFKSCLGVLKDAQDFLTFELTSATLKSKLDEYLQDNDHDDEKTSYFELIGDIPSYMDEIECVCSKCYTDEGLIVVLLFFDGVFYCVIQNGDGDQPLLDVQFPDVSREGDGLTLNYYNDCDKKKGSSSWVVNWLKLSIWKSLTPLGNTYSCNEINSKTSDISLIDLSSGEYQQTYCVLKSGPNVMDDEDRSFRNSLFRFGSWCYSGKIELVRDIEIHDIPYVFPAIRIQQDKMDFFCEAGMMPADSVYTKPLEYISNVTRAMVREVLTSEKKIDSLISRLSKMGLEESANSWLNGDPSQTFFQFSISRNELPLMIENGIDLIATKSYAPNGSITVSIYFKGVFYLCISNGDGEQPLLDSKCPSIIPGRGYQLKTYSSGLPDFLELRKLSIWQSLESTECELQNTLENSYEVTVSNGPESKKVEISLKADDPVLGKRVNSDKVVKRASSVPLENSQHDSNPKKSIRDSCSLVEQKSVESKASVMTRTKNCYVDLNSTSLSVNISIAATKVERKKNLGGVHHLAPLKRPS